MIITPASQKELLRAMADDTITTLINAGAVLTRPAAASVWEAIKAHWGRRCLSVDGKS